MRFVESAEPVRLAPAHIPERPDLGQSSWQQQTPWQAQHREAIPACPRCTTPPHPGPDCSAAGAEGFAARLADPCLRHHRCLRSMHQLSQPFMDSRTSRRQAWPALMTNAVYSIPNNMIRAVHQVLLTETATVDPSWHELCWCGHTPGEVPTARWLQNPQASRNQTWQDTAICLGPSSAMPM